MSAGNELGWELNQKHVFVLSSSGKPIFSSYGDEQDMATTFGLLQAVLSMVIDSGDSIKFIQAGQRKIVFLVKQSLYFVCISSTNEPEVVLLKQLQFLYSQILLVLTAKVHDVLEKNPSTDLRQLLGSDTTRLMKANAIDHRIGTVSDIAPIYVAFESLRNFACKSDLRREIFLSLKFCVENAGAALGILMYHDSLVVFSPNSAIELPLTSGDAVLLTHFVANSASLRSSDQHWIPVCLPEFNEKGFLQAYVSSLNFSGGSERAKEKGTETESKFTLVLVAASADPDVFRSLHKNRLYFEKSLSEASISDELLLSLSTQQQKVFQRTHPTNPYCYYCTPFPY